MPRLILLSLISLAVTAALIPGSAPGCAIAPRKGESGSSVQTTSEQAVIIYDEATRTEHFIRTASFSGTSADFGFLVPTPSKPEIAEADAGIYAELAHVTKPKIEIRKVYESHPLSFGCGARESAKFANVGSNLAPGTKSDVTVVEQKRVGNLDYTILQAETPQALRDWFVKNGYDDRPELSEWLKPYIAMKWFISAYKIAADVKGPVITTAKRDEAPRKVALTGTTVRMSFKTDRPIYPYREPSDARASNPPGGRLLRVYVLASTISAGLIGFENGKTWPGQAVWAGLTPRDSAIRTMASANLGIANEADKAWFLTEFEDRSSPRPGTDDLYFGPAKDQSPIERPPIIQYEYIDTTENDRALFLGVVFVAALAFTIGIVAIVRRLKR